MPKTSRRKCIGQRTKGKRKGAKQQRNEAHTPENNRRTLPFDGQYTEMDSDSDGNVDADDDVNVDENDKGNDDEKGGNNNDNKVNDERISRKRRSKETKLAIYHIFVNILRCPLPGEWDGKDGIVMHIATLLSICTNSRKHVKTTLERINMCLATNEEYTGEYVMTNPRESRLVPPGSYYEQLIADYTEQGVGMKLTHALVNQ